MPFALFAILWICAILSSGSPLAYVLHGVLLADAILAIAFWSNGGFIRFGLKPQFEMSLKTEKPLVAKAITLFFYYTALAILFYRGWQGRLYLMALSLLPDWSWVRRQRKAFGEGMIATADRLYPTCRRLLVANAHEVMEGESPSVTSCPDCGCDVLAKTIAGKPCEFDCDTGGEDSWASNAYRSSSTVLDNLAKARS